MKTDAMPREAPVRFRRGAWRSLVFLGFLAAGMVPGSSRADSLAVESGAREATELQAAMQPLRQSLQEAIRRRDAALERLESSTGVRREAADEQLWQRQLDVGRALAAVAKNLARQQEVGVDVSAMVDSLGGQFRANWPRYKQQLQIREAEVDSLWGARQLAEAGERLQIERQLGQRGARLQVAYGFLVNAIGDLQPLGLDLSAVRDFTAQKLTEWAETLDPMVRVAVRARDDLAGQLALEPTNADLKLELQALEERLDRATRNLAATAEMMEKLDLETAAYRQLVIAATGQINAGILDRDVALGLLQQFRDRTTEMFRTEGPRWALKLVVFVFIVLAFRLLGTLARRIVRRSVRASKLQLSQLMQDTLVSWSSRVVVLLGFLIALSQLGLEIGPLLAGLGIAGFVLGFALQDSLSNFAAGAMILLYRPFDVGDFIEAAGTSGKVSRMSLVSTTILTFDNQTLIVPNSKIWGDVIRNVTAQTTRRVDLVFGISYADDVEKAETVLRQVVTSHPKVLDEPAPVVRLHKLGESSVDFVVRPWCRTEDYWEVYWDVTRQVKLRFDAEGISIPFPQRDLHVEWKGALPAPAADGDASRR